jgi:hypothetical protein
MRRRRSWYRCRWRPSRSSNGGLMRFVWLRGFFLGAALIYVASFFAGLHFGDDFIQVADVLTVAALLWGFWSYLDEPKSEDKRDERSRFWLYFFWLMFVQDALQFLEDKIVEPLKRRAKIDGVFFAVTLSLALFFTMMRFHDYRGRRSEPGSPKSDDGVVKGGRWRVRSRNP